MDGSAVPCFRVSSNRWEASAIVMFALDLVLSADDLHRNAHQFRCGILQFWCTPQSEHLGGALGKADLGRLLAGVCKSSSSSVSGAMSAAPVIPSKT